MKISAVILLLLQIIANSERLPDCSCVETFNSVEECLAALLEYFNLFSPPPPPPLHPAPALDGMLVHRRVTLDIKFAVTHLCTWVERRPGRIKGLAHEHNTMSPARARS